MSISHPCTGWDWARIEAITSMRTQLWVMLSPARVLSKYSVMTRVDYWNKSVFRKLKSCSLLSGEQISETLGMSMRAQQMHRRVRRKCCCVVRGKECVWRLSGDHRDHIHKHSVWVICLAGTAKPLKPHSRASDAHTCFPTWDRYVCSRAHVLLLLSCCMWCVTYTNRHTCM